MDLPNCHKKLPVAVKKTALRVLQNDNIMVPTSIGSSSISKDKGPATDPNRASGTKRSSSENPMNHHDQQSPGNNAANGHLVYVRRKSDAEFGKRSACENPSANAYRSHSRQLCEEETAQPKSQTKEPKVSCFLAFAPFPMASSMNSSANSLPLSLEKSAIRIAPVESNYVTASASPTTGNPKGLKHGQWEERYHQLQMILRKLDQSDLEVYNQSMLMNYRILLKIL